MGNSDKTTLGDRMKLYEEAARSTLPPRMPVILRVDGKAFHTYTKNATKPFDYDLIGLMNGAAMGLCENIQGAQMAYVQSDEISVLIHGYKKFTSSPWFDNQVQKMVSVGASIATSHFAAGLFDEGGNRTKFDLPVYFDARVFVLPENEVCNYFLWRQQDCSRNSIQMLARSIYSHKQLDGKNGNVLKEMCDAKGQSWDALPTQHRRGRCVVKKTHVRNEAHGQTVRSFWEVDNEIPVFSENRDYVNQYLVCEE